MPEIVTSHQTEHYELHHAKLSGVKDIQQTDVSSSPDTITKFEVSQVQIQLSEYLQQTFTTQVFVYTRTVKPVTRSAIQVLKIQNIKLLKQTLPLPYSLLRKE